MRRAGFGRMICWTVVFALSMGNQGDAQTRILVDADRRVRLERNGQPFVVRGVGGKEVLQLLAAAGGNAIRTWSAEDLGPLLDDAKSHGLAVCVGMWLGHPRHGFDYHDADQVGGQLEDCLAVVREYHDHPAVLMWAIGNEMEEDGRDPAIWYAINHIAREIERIDPDHPTMTVIAELGADEVKLRNLDRFCPDVDIVGVNSYGGIATLPERYRRSGCKKPYIVTEHGPHGPWEVEKTRWGAPLEATSTEKARQYASGYRSVMNDPNGLCLGSFAFLWGHKQETTATWFGMLLPDGQRLGAVDAMAELWQRRPPRNRCPQVTGIEVAEADLLKPGQTISAAVTASDPDGDPLTVRWVLRYDSGTIGVGGDAQAAEAMFADAFEADGMRCRVTMPEGGGGYRLFAYVEDNHRGAATANVPLYVDAPRKAMPAPQPELPLVIYAERDAGPYAPSGFMGNTQAIEMDFTCEVQPRVGQHCLRVAYRANDGWGGVLWQSPPNDWEGEQPGGFDLTAAKALEFFVRGETTGTVVSFKLGGTGSGTLYADTAVAERADVRLTTVWQKIRIPLEGLDRSRIKTGFGWSLAGQGQPVTFYLDQIRYVGQ